MKNILFLSFFISTIFLIGCKDNAKRNLQPEIAGCDSATVMYYTTPGKPRFFKMSKVYDKETIVSFSKAINGKVIKPRDTCTTQGKIYFYANKGAIYIAYFSRLDDCMTFSFMKTGEKYFTKMPVNIRDSLNKWETIAREPVSTDVN